MSDLEFWAENRQFGLRISKKQIKEMVRSCQRACPTETGGILLGHYSVSQECAVVTKITQAPVDSRSGPTWFFRGIRGLQEKLDFLWRRDRQFYIGEWHFHPFGTPQPSPTDIKQMQEISESEEYHCPEPVLLILGGNPQLNWSAGCYVFRRARSYIPLLHQNSD